ncbi:MAG TPA: DUF4129 domain-containing protein [Pirellulales bacterium]|nr:DUF4129 domain-containing protein [Pirellulales bacterium]
MQTAASISIIPRIAASLVALLGAAGSARWACAEQAAGVEEAREALGREGFPWYDKQEDALKPVHVSEPWDLPQGSKTNFSFGVSGWEWLMFAAFVAVLAVVIWLLIKAYLNREETLSTAGSHRLKQTAVDDAARIEALPFRIRRGDIDLLAEARRLYEEGKYGEAIIYLFSYQLVEMDRRQVIRLAKGKTNRQYLRDLRRLPPLRTLVERSMIAFEEVFFGGHTLDRSRFETVWLQLGQFNALVAGQAPA